MLFRSFSAFFYVTILITLVSGDGDSISLIAESFAAQESNDLSSKTIDSSQEISYDFKLNSNPAETCNETVTCKNGGSCLNHVCVCLLGTSGPFCKTVIDCDERKYLCGKSEKTSCKYDVQLQKAVCHCHIFEYRFDDASRTCKSCLCTPTFSQDLASFYYCEYRNGKQMCDCTENYAYDPSQQICKSCNCGPNSDWCGYDELGNTICGCKEGFLQQGSDCQKCRCGEHGFCQREANKRYFSYGCTCDAGYAEYNWICVECTCGKYGQCIFDKNGTQVGCKCNDGYAESSGVCKMCNCGENSNCTFSGDQKICGCDKGYEDINGFCTDINECEKHNPCKKSTKCINLLGGFKCVCDEGYVSEMDPDSELTVEFCQDIDECKNLTACTEANTQCMNTQGSYECICQPGYASRGGTGTTTFCEKTSSSNIYTLVLVTSFAAFILTAAVVLYVKRNLRRRGNLEEED